MKQFSINSVGLYGLDLRGFSGAINIICKSKKQACELLQCSLYELNNYGYSFEPRDPECIKEPFTKFIFFDSGEMRYANQNLFRKMLPIKVAEDFIAGYRKTFQTYIHTMEYYESKLK